MIRMGPVKQILRVNLWLHLFWFMLKSWCLTAKFIPCFWYIGHHGVFVYRLRVLTADVIYWTHFKSKQSAVSVLNLLVNLVLIADKWFSIRNVLHFALFWHNCIWPFSPMWCYASAVLVGVSLSVCLWRFGSDFCHFWVPLIMTWTLWLSATFFNILACSNVRCNKLHVHKL